jgi:hypothetical protein|tara:strand:- start:437 stop:646 length:210 start_codon:yes stop_codon:yes gene_type:complete
MKQNQTSVVSIIEVLKSGYVAQALQIANSNLRFLKALKKIIRKRLTRRRGKTFEADIIAACKIINTWTI